MLWEFGSRFYSKMKNDFYSNLVRFALLKIKTKNALLYKSGTARFFFWRRLVMLTFEDYAYKHRVKIIFCQGTKEDFFLNIEI